MLTASSAQAQQKSLEDASATEVKAAVFDIDRQMEFLAQQRQILLEALRAKLEEEKQPKQKPKPGAKLPE